MKLKLNNTQKNCIIDTVKKSFMRVIKNYNEYAKVRNYITLFIEKSDKRYDDVNHLFVELYKIAEEELSENNHIRNIKYDLIVVYVNTLLRHLVETCDINKELIPKMGEEIFELSCSTLYSTQYHNDMREMGMDKNQHDDMEINSILQILNSGDTRNIHRLLEHIRRYNPELFARITNNIL